VPARLGVRSIKNCTRCEGVGASSKGWISSRTLVGETKAGVLAQEPRRTFFVGAKTSVAVGDYSPKGQSPR